jgi:uncharacterized protein (DUF1697 family)
VKTFIALLRGINVGGKTIIPMPKLKSLFASMGLEDVSTYIQSGNVVFSSPTGDGAVAARRVAARGREIYLRLPNGAGRSKLTIDYFEKRLGVRATGRNWKTVTKLLELTQRAR